MLLSVRILLVVSKGIAAWKNVQPFSILLEVEVFLLSDSDPGIQSVPVIFLLAGSIQSPKKELSNHEFDGLADRLQSLPFEG